ncbi:MAG: VWA domain-containing protein [Woeseia sp.]
MKKIRNDDSVPTPHQEPALARHILMFSRALRRAGLQIGPGQVIDALAAVRTVGLQRRDDFYQALCAVLVSDPSRFRLFQQAFQVYFQDPRLLERLMALQLPAVSAALPDATADTAIRRLPQAAPRPDTMRHKDTPAAGERPSSWSHREVLRHKDFEQMTLAERREAKDLLRDDIEALKDIATRRFRPCAYGHRYDLRRSMQTIMRNNGQLIQLMRKRRIERPPVLVLICDISGSMSHYSRVFMHFAHALSTRNQTVLTFVFGTRLTNISHRLRDRDVDRALSQITHDVRDWHGGTRIAECLERFNKDWGRRVLAQNAIVILLSDGLERDTKSNLEFQMMRLRRSCRQLIWLNPVLRYAAFEPKADGIRKMLPHVDLFLPAHNVSSLTGLGRVLGEGARRLLNHNERRIAL